MRVAIERGIFYLLILISIGMLVFSYLTFFHQMNPVEFHNEPFPVWQEGDNICYVCERTRSVIGEVIIKRTFKDGVMFITPPLATTGNHEGYANQTICFPIPSTLPSGEYEIINELTFKVNPIAERIVASRTQRLYINN